MQYPTFFDEVEPIVLYDPLAEFLGAARNVSIVCSQASLVGHERDNQADKSLYTNAATPLSTSSNRDAK